MDKANRLGATPHHYRLVETAIGLCGLAWTGRGLARVQLPEADRKTTEQRVRGATGVPGPGSVPPDIARCMAQLQAYFLGDPIDFRDVMLDLDGISSFNSGVYRALREVGHGATTTYGELARAVAAPGAARAVGVAMARNPWPVVVPCHRVLASGRRMGGFSAPGGTLTKERLLALEGIALGCGTPLLPGLIMASR